MALINPSVGIALRGCGRLVAVNDRWIETDSKGSQSIDRGPVISEDLTSGWLKVTERLGCPPPLGTPETRVSNQEMLFRAIDLISKWRGPVRSSREEAAEDARIQRLAVQSEADEDYLYRMQFLHISLDDCILVVQKNGKYRMDVVKGFDVWPLEEGGTGRVWWDEEAFKRERDRYRNRRFRVDAYGDMVYDP